MIKTECQSYTTFLTAANEVEINLFIVKNLNISLKLA
jgi:hypothetical protein